MIRLALAAALAVAASSACAPRFRSREIPEPLQLTEESSGQRYDIVVGQEALLRLGSNPTTGYHWSLADSHSAVMAVVGEPAYQGPAEPRPGAGGTETWRLKAMTAGRATLVFEYRRPWDKVLPPGRTVTITFLSR